jgi:hypothetical protein
VAAVGREPNPYYQAARLAELAPRLSAAALAGALDVAQKIKDDDQRARAMHGLAPYLQEDLLRRVVSQIGPLSRSFSFTLVPLAQYPEPLPVLGYVSRIGPDSRSISFTLAPLAPYLPEALLREAFTRAANIYSYAERAAVLAALAHYLPEPLAAEALDFARQQAARQGGLVHLALYLPDEVAAEFISNPFDPEWRWNSALPRFTSSFDVPGLLLQASGFLLQAQRWAASVASWEHVAELARQAISYAKSAGSGRGYASWDLRVQISCLIGLLPYLPQPYLTETAAAAAIRLIVDESSEELPGDQVVTLGTYLPRALLADAVSPLIPGLPCYLPDELLAAALETACAKKSVPWLFAVTPRLGPAVLPEALRVARELGGAALQAQLMADCGGTFARLPPEVLYPVWCDTLRGMANLSRAEFLRLLGKFGPIVAALGGPDAADEVRQAVDQVGRWWP